MRPPHIVLVDDDPTVADAVREALAPLEAALTVHGDGRAGLEAVLSEPADLLVLDLLLPRLSGFDLIAAVRDDPTRAELPIVVATPLVLEDGRLSESQRSCAADRFLPKPLDGRRLLAVVEELLQGGSEVVDEAPTVLLVEDNEYNAELVRLRLESGPYQVHHATDGGRALELFESLGPEIVLLDIQIPMVDGIEVLRRIRATDPDVMVIMMTAYGSEKIAVEAMKIGADDYLTKPLEHRSIARFLEEAWDRNRLRVRARRLAERLEASNAELMRKYEALFDALRTLEESHDALVHAQRLAAVTETAVSINHEINNPLCSIMGNTDLLLRKAGGGDEDVQRKLRSIERESLRIKDITKKLANLANVVLTDYAGGVKMIDIERSLVPRDER